MKSGSNLERVLSEGHFAVTGELGPPKSANPDVVRQKAKILKNNVDAVNITDCQTAIVRMSSIAAGILAHQEGVEPVIQMTCRDRNRIGMQSDIMGATALGMKNLLCLTGDHQKFGNHPGAKGVFDMDSIQLLGMVKNMRDEKVFQCGEAIKSHEPRLFLGAAANPFAGPFEFRAARLGKKVSSGADFIQTQIIYNVEKFAKFMEMVRDLGLEDKVYILAGITPPRSLGMARYMKSSVPGLEVTDEIISRMKDAKDKEEEGINIAVDIINQVKAIKGVSGVHLMAIEWESAVPEIVSRAELLPRPFVAEAPAVEAVPKRAEQITVAAPVASGDDLLEAAKAEARGIIEEAKKQAAQIAKDSGYQPIEREEAGEEEMNEKERLMALDSVRLGLEALKKSFGLNDEQYEALANFARTEAILSRVPALKGSGSAPSAASPTVASAPTGQVAPDTAAAEAKKAAEAKAAEDAKKTAETKAAEEAKKAAEAKAAEEAKKAAEAKVAAEAKKAAEAKAAEEAKKTAEAKAAGEAKKATTKAAKEKAAPEAKKAEAKLETAGGLDVGVLKIEEKNLATRGSSVPAEGYIAKYTGSIRETVLGFGDHTLTVGGSSTLPFQLFEGDMPRKPAIAMEVLDIIPAEWPESLTKHFTEVLDNPVSWAQKCVSEYGAEALCVSLVGTDPNGMNRPSSEAAKIAVDIINAVEAPIIVWGCGNSEKDTESLREITSMVGDKKVCLAPLTDANYRSLGATAMAFGHPVVAASPIDVNLAKQLNILLENLGVSLNTVLIDPSIGALGYGIEYTYSVMERIRLAAMTQQDEKLQVPFICNLGREVWKAKETRLPSDDLLGDQEIRGVLMEAITASCMLAAGGELLIMRHPKAIALTKALINGLVG
jgi:CO dehydrogenase/acetyl-CoA synthase delta subunit